MTGLSIWSGFPAVPSAWVPTIIIRRKRRSIASRSTVSGSTARRSPTAQFKAFVNATGHVTFAEIPPDPKDYPGALPHMLYAGSLVFTPPQHAVDLRDWSQWWQFMKGADWRHPYGPKSNINGLDDHPVVHVRLCRCAGLCEMGRQGTADRGRMGVRRARRARRCRVSPGATSSRPAAGTWPTPGRASFPRQNSARRRLRAHLAGDGVSAERLRRPRHDRQCLGMDDATGTRRSTRPMRAEGLLHSAKIRAAAAEAASYDPGQPNIKIPRKVIKGGSHLCAPNYCRRYRPAARHAEDGRYLHQPSRISLRPEELANAIISTVEQRAESSNVRRQGQTIIPKASPTTSITAPSDRRSMLLRHLYAGRGGGADFGRGGTGPEGRARSPGAAPAAAPAPAPAAASGRKPNILVIWGDDVGVCQHQRLLERPDGLRDAEHRPHRPRGAQVPALLRRAVAAPPAARRSSPASTAFAPASPRSASPARRWA